MKELIGQCTNCCKDLYCLDGFFNGVHTEQKELYCFECHESLRVDKENPQS